MDGTIEKVIYDLATIGNVGIGDKVSVSSEHIDIHKEGFLQPLVRIYNGDSRMKTCSYICNTISLAITLMTLLSESVHFQDKEDSLYSSRYHTFLRLFHSFAKAKKGIGNLLLTYHSDQLICMQLSSVIEKCEHSIGANAKILKVPLPDM